MDHGNNRPKHKDNKQDKTDQQCDNFRKGIRNWGQDLKKQCLESMEALDSLHLGVTFLFHM